MLLYDEVTQKLEPDDGLLTSSSCSKISMMSGEQAENILLLIIRHCHLNMEDFSPEFLIDNLYKYKPATKTGLGAKFSSNHIPDDLQRIISCYLRLITK